MPTNRDIGKRGPELVFGLVSALGTDLDMVCQILTDELRSVGYSARLIHLSKQISELDKWSALPTMERLDKYIEAHQKAGNDVREMTGLGDALARLGVGAIRLCRETENKDANLPIPRVVYIIRQLKHVDELELLRGLYGHRFYLIAAYSPRDMRIQSLSTKIANSYNSLEAINFRSQAETLINTDEFEASNKFGQNVRHTFPQADVFVDASEADALKKSIQRFIELVFGNPFITPSRDEFAMFHAKAAALRSADLARQVGAVIASIDGTVIAVGTNEVPKAGGGQYWDGDKPDARDFTTGHDQSKEMRKTALGDILTRLKDSGWLKDEFAKLDSSALFNKAAYILRETRLMGIGEFGRTVHAEMSAILDAARRGIAVNDQTLYTTCFPCQNCARHIVGAGLQRVVYIEPYPKSLATTLHDDSICVEGKQGNKVSFVPFIGISPRQYLELFEMVERRGPAESLVSWNKHDALPRFGAHLLRYAPTDLLEYIDRELIILKELKLLLEEIK